MDQGSIIQTVERHSTKLMVKRRKLNEEVCMFNHCSIVDYSMSNWM